MIVRAFVWQGWLGFRVIAIHFERVDMRIKTARCKLHCSSLTTPIRGDALNRKYLAAQPYISRIVRQLAMKRAHSTEACWERCSTIACLFDRLYRLPVAVFALRQLPCETDRAS